MTRLRICSYNIHKGFSQFNRNLVVHTLRDRLRQLDADLVFLQEVQGQHLRHAQHNPDWPALPQHEFLATGIWPQTAYGGNVVHRHGHHGNAILSKYPILEADNQDVSLSRFERRGLLHCRIQLPDGTILHAICIHISLTETQRRLQLSALVHRVGSEIPADAPVVVAGDFNDWRGKANTWLTQRLHMQEIFTALNGRPARSFPSRLPFLTLDRIYVRGLRPITAEVLNDGDWSAVSDHLPLLAELEPAGP